MSFLRILSRVAQYRLARAVLALVLVAIAAIFGTSKAHASAHTSRDEAYAHCASNVAATIAAVPNDRRQSAAGPCLTNLPTNPDRYFEQYDYRPYSGAAWTTVVNSASFHSWTIQCPSPKTWDEVSKTCAEPNLCGTKPSVTSIFMPVGGARQCVDGCQWVYQQNADDTTSTRQTTGETCTGSEECPTGFFRNTQMRTCDPVQPECKENEALVDGVCQLNEVCPDGMVSATPGTAGAVAAGSLYCKPAESECPAGHIKAPSGQCLPGDGLCAAGEARKADGTCGVDANNDGVPDAEDTDPNNDPGDESFSGGDTCQQPPSCAGNPIQCGIARIAWRTECNTRKNRNISGGSCQSVPICTGEKCDAMEYGQLIQTWKAACTLEKILAKDSGSEGDDETVEPGEANYDVYQLTIDNAGEAGEGGDGPDGVFTDQSANNDGAGGVPGGTGELDDSGFGYSRSCPSFPPVQVFDQTITFNVQPVCDWLSLGGMIVLVMASLASLRIMSSSTQV